MDIVTQEKKNSKRYLPHTVSTKEGAVKLYRQTKDPGFVLRRYHISKASLMRWNRLYDGTKESLTPKSHRPHSQHPNAHTEEELRWITTTIAVTPISAFASYMANCVRKRPTADTRDHCIVCLSGLDTGRKWNPRRKYPSIWDTMIRRRNWGKSGKWM